MHILPQRVHYIGMRRAGAQLIHMAMFGLLPKHHLCKISAFVSPDGSWQLTTGREVGCLCRALSFGCICTAKSKKADLMSAARADSPVPVAEALMILMLKATWLLFAKFPGALILEVVVGFQVACHSR